MLVAFATILAAAQLPTFRTGISEIHVDVGVVNRDGRSITGRTKSDFRVFDEGQEQTLTGFVAEEQPLDIILLFDVSGSMHNQSIKSLAPLAKRFMN